MVTKITDGIQVSVETFYQHDYSDPLRSEYLFAYQITIFNHNNFPVKLLRRHWYIFDSNGEHREVEGEGVVGVQPIVQPGEQYQYISSCNLRSDMGKMQGTYQMMNTDNHQLISVKIPPFEMVAPFKQN